MRPVDVPVRLALAALLALSTACGGTLRDGIAAPLVPGPPTPAAAPSDAPAPSPSATEAVTTGALFAEVARLRGLAPKKDVTPRILDAASFARAVTRATSEPGAPLPAQARVLHDAFGLPLPRASASGAHRYAGLYDFRTHELIARGASPERVEGVIVHELVHALQDQHFGLIGEDAPPDQALALRALYEGDAVLVRERFAAHRAGEDEHAFVERAVGAVDHLPPAAVAKAVGAPAHVLGAPAAQRDEALFPYLAGLRFSWRVLAAGGPPALDAAFSTRPPRSTMEILHPEKYLGGTVPITIANPVVPAAAEVDHGTLGELRTSLVLGRCGQKNDAVGWAGDRFAYARLDDGGRALVWVTVWDDAEAAVRFASRLESARRCLPGASLPSAVVRDGRVVAFASAPRHAAGLAQSTLSAERAAGLK